MAVLTRRGYSPTGISQTISFGGLAVNSPYLDFRAQRMLQNDIAMGHVSVNRYSVTNAGAMKTTGFDALDTIVTTPYSPLIPRPSVAASRVSNINTLFGQAIGGAGRGQGPFSNTRFNMIGQMEVIDPTDPRHTSRGYADNWQDLTNQYWAGTITGSQLFNRVGEYEANTDRDRINSPQFNFSAPPRVRFSFNSRGGGSITGTGITFSPGRSSTRSTYNFGF